MPKDLELVESLLDLFVRRKLLDVQNFIVSRSLVIFASNFCLEKFLVKVDLVRLFVTITHGTQVTNFLGSRQIIKCFIWVSQHHQNFRSFEQGLNIVWLHLKDKVDRFKTLQKIFESVQLQVANGLVHADS